MLLEVKNIRFEREGKKILDNVSLTILKNDFITIIGPNGSGKSTLIKVLMGILKPDNLKDDARIYKKENLRIGYVPQKIIPDPAMPISVKEFLKLVKNTSKQAISEVMKEVGIDYSNKLLHVLSGGELQKVLLARALLHQPDLLILDEPAQNLDIGNQLKFYNLIERIYSTRKCSVLMISHDLHMVMATSKQVVCLYHHICCSGAPHVVTKDPEFIKIFGSDMSNMMAYYQHHHTHNHPDHIHTKDCDHA